MAISSNLTLTDKDGEFLTKLDYAKELRNDGEEPEYRDKEFIFNIVLYEDAIDPVDMQILDAKLVGFNATVTEGEVEYDTALDLEANIKYTGLPADRSSEKVEDLAWLTALASTTYEGENAVYMNPVVITGVTLNSLGINWKQDSGNGTIEYVDLDGNTGTVASFDLLPEDFMSITQVKFDSSTEGKAAHSAKITLTFAFDLLIRKRHYSYTNNYSVGEGEGAVAMSEMIYEQDPIVLGVNPYWVRGYQVATSFDTDITFELGANSDNAKNIEIYNKKSVASKMMYQQNPEKLEKDMAEFPESKKEKIRLETLLTPLKPILLAKVMKIDIPKVDSPDPTIANDGLDEARAKADAMVAKKAPDGSTIKGNLADAEAKATAAAKEKADALMAKIPTEAPDMVGGFEAATAKALAEAEKIALAKFAKVQAGIDEMFKKMKENAAKAMAVIEGFMIPSPPPISVAKKKAIEEAKKQALAAAASAAGPIAGQVSGAVGTATSAANTASNVVAKVP